MTDVTAAGGVPHLRPLPTDHSQLPELAKPKARKLPVKEDRLNWWHAIASAISAAGGMLAGPKLLANLAVQIGLEPNDGNKDKLSDELGQMHVHDVLTRHGVGSVDEIWLTDSGYGWGLPLSHGMPVLKPFAPRGQQVPMAEADVVDAVAAVVALDARNRELEEELARTKEKCDARVNEVEQENSGLRRQLIESGHKLQILKNKILRLVKD